MISVIHDSSIGRRKKSNDLKTTTDTGKKQKLDRKMQKECVEAIKTIEVFWKFSKIKIYYNTCHETNSWEKKSPTKWILVQ